MSAIDSRPRERGTADVTDRTLSLEANRATPRFDLSARALADVRPGNNRRAAPLVDILMYHAIDDARASTSITPATFAAQMRALADSGVAVIAMDSVRAHLRSGIGRAVAITFDDGYQNFADTAWPILSRHGFPAMVYLPTDHVGRNDTWNLGHRHERKLMAWPTIRALAADGVHFGNHSATHADLSKLAPDRIEAEIDSATRRMNDELGAAPRHAAPPFGRSNAYVHAALARRFDTSVGTRLGSAAVAADVHDLPRLEMLYFADPARWAAQLTGRGGPYLAARRAARGIRQRLRCILP